MALNSIPNTTNKKKKGEVERKTEGKLGCKLTY
jgi:hypothetical protein